MRRATNLAPFRVSGADADLMFDALENRRNRNRNAARRLHADLETLVFIDRRNGDRAMAFGTDTHSARARFKDRRNALFMTGFGPHADLIAFIPVDRRHNFKVACRRLDTDLATPFAINSRH